MNQYNQYPHYPQGMIFCSQIIVISWSYTLDPHTLMNCVDIRVLMFQYNDEQFRFIIILKLCLPSGWSLNKTKSSLGILRVFPPSWNTVFLAVCLMFFNAHLFAARMSSCCSFTHTLLLCKYWSLYFASLTHVLQAVGTLQLNINSYGW